MAALSAALYVRVSSEEQALEGYSLSAQERAGRAYAETNGFTIYDVYADEGKTGRNDNRPQLQRLRRDIRLGRIKTVIIHKCDRLARNAQLTFNLLSEWSAHGVALVSICEQMDFSTPMGKVILASLASFAQFFSENLGLEIKKGLTEKARQGGWVGPVPIGYEKRNGALEPSADAEAVRRIFELYATGRHSYGTLADALNAEGYHTLNWRTGERGYFGRESIRTILRNHAYAGYTQSSGVEYPGKHQPLIDEDLWRRCEVIRATRRAKEGAYSVKGPKIGGLLTEISFCAECGARMWYQWSGKEGYYKGTYYTCAGRSRRTCQARLVRGDVVEQDALDLLRVLAIPYEWRSDIIAEAMGQVAPERAAPTVDRQGIETQLKRLGRVYIDELISDEDYQRQRTYLLGRLAELDQPVAPAPDILAAAETLLTIEDVLAVATPHEQRSLLRCVFDRIWVVRREIKAITPTSAFSALIGAITEGGVADGTWKPQLRYNRPWPAHWTQYQVPYIHHPPAAAR